MIGAPRGNEGAVEAINRATGKTIASLAIESDDRDNNGLRFGFTDGTTLAIFDDGQSCCEHRYMHTDDPLDAFVGAQFRGAEVRDGPTEDTEYEIKESQFLIVHTSAGDFTVVNYNEHNGYYGGFDLKAKEYKEGGGPHNEQA